MGAYAKQETSAEESHWFDRLLTNIWIPSINLPAGEIDHAIEATQRTLCERLGLERSRLAQWDECAGGFVITHSSAGNDCLLGHSFTPQDIPWVSSRIIRGEVIHFTRESMFIESAARDVETLFHPKTRSAAFFPLQSRGQMLGFLAFGTSQAEGGSPELFGDRMHLITEIFGNVIARDNIASGQEKCLEQKSLEGDDPFRRTIECFPTAVVFADDDGKIVLSNSRAAEAFGYKQEELVGQTIETLVPQCLGEARSGRGFESAESLSTTPSDSVPLLYAKRKDGSEFQVEVASRPLRIDGNSLILSAITDVTERKQTEQALIDANVQLLEANERIREMKEHLEQENLYFRQEIKPEANHFEIVGRSPAILHVLVNSERVAATDSTVLLLGETGSGKELVARTIHRNSKRKARPMVTVNCAALPASLVENELFGRERGAYTGALTREVGRFELADRSTIFLDEIGELPLELQSKLLRVLQEGEFERLGSSKTMHVDVRLIAATSRDLQAEVKEGKFREDLYYRLNVFPIRVPPLRERRDDIPMLTWHFLRELGGRMGRDVQTVRAATMKALQDYCWPGNVRELRNLIERSLILNPGPVFEAELPERSNGALVTGTSIEEIERNHIRCMLERARWRIRGAGGAAELLGLKPTTMEARMKKLGIVRN